MYLIFDTLEAAQAAQARIDSNMVEAVRQHRPDIVSDTGIIPVNAKTGELDYEAQRTTTWCEPAEYEDVWYLLKPDLNHPYFVGVDLLAGVIDYTESAYLPGQEPPEGDIGMIDTEVTEDFSND